MRGFSFIPAISPAQLRAWRVVLACALALVAILSREMSWPRAAAVVVPAAAFAIGFWPRIAFAAMVAAFAWFTLLQSEQRSVHDLGLPVLTLIGLLRVPGHAPRAVASRAYGFAVWWPSLTLGLAMASAAYTKLQRTGFDWVTSGAVRYHFVMDSPNAPTDLGLSIAGSYPASVALSAAAIVVEATIIVGAFTASPRVRLVVFGALVALLLGFLLMQGVFWPLWWVCALALLPWHGRASTQQADSPTRGQVLAAIAVAAVQLVAAFGGIEREPYISNFPMYSTTYTDPAEFDQEMRARFTRIVDAGAATSWVLALPQDARSTLIRAAEGDRYSQDGRDLLCPRVPAGTSVVDVTIERRTFDWDNGRFTPDRRLALPPANLCAVCRTCP